MIVSMILFVPFFLQAVPPPARLPEAITLLLGVFASVIVQFVKGRFVSRTSRFVISVALSIATAVISYIVAKPQDTDFVVFVIHVFAYSQITYNMFWKVIWENVLKQKEIGK